MIPVTSNRKLLSITCLCFIWLFLFHSCETSDTSLPEGIINSDLMTEILIDIKLYDAAFQQGALVGNIRKSALSPDSFVNPRSVISKSFREEVKERLKRDTMMKYSEIDTFDYNVWQTDDNDTIALNQISPHLGADYELIFSKHKVSRKEFENSFQYYAERPHIFEEILTNAINKLIILQIHLESDKQP